jgi:hypothetical protein
MQTILVYGYVLDGIVTAIGEVGISGSRSSPTLLNPARRSIRGGDRDSSRFLLVLLCLISNFKFQIYETLAEGRLKQKPKTLSHRPPNQYVRIN